MATKQTEINFKIELDENNIPEKMKWSATDGQEEEKTCEAVMMSIWDKSENTALRIDLWTKDLLMDEMKMFIHQTMVTLADTYERSTNDEKLANDMRDFCKHFAEKADIYDK